jgi:prepilin-type N-terminal cleavage/methylation domain-containing protein
MKNIKAKGFTLIELLVVISIVGLLSSVILSGLSSARGKSKDSSIISEVLQLRNLIHLEYSDTGSYAGLQASGGWILSDSFSCDIARLPTPNSKYATKVIEICNKIKADTTTSGARLYIGSVNPTVTGATGSSFTIMARLPSGSGNDYFCAGHNGRTSRGIPGTPTPWLNPGCYSDSTNK